MKIRRTFLISMVIAFATLSLPGAVAFSQTNGAAVQTATLLARRQRADGVDNYVQAAFSFKHGVNGDAGRRITRNNWDLLFGNSPDADTFDVTMVTDDCSRIKDLGAFNWWDDFQIPELPAHAEPTREPGVKVIVGHLYLVHSKDRDDDHYAMFRVEALDPGVSVTISWQLISPVTTASARRL